MSTFKLVFKTHRKTATSFILVGFITAIIYFSIFSIIWKLLGINYKISVSIAYIITMLFHFTMNKKVTFKNHSTTINSQILRYIAMVSVNYLLTIVIVHIFVEILKTNPYTGIFFAVGGTVLSGYFLARFWVFPDKKLMESN